ncbi:unnamed protein product [Caenorhabditis angaria]|uniref:TOG domain-containing protein n=1 Tax=Caenorhabditis angaria TaxID=860376 RepID=A0A9P1MZ22_9PELO|nr:unnamed protein product [Caenorhabditis angaria]
MDEWDFLDEVDVIQKWPVDQKKVVFEGGKWNERKAGLEALNSLIEQNPRLSTTTMTVYGELMDEIRKILDRESNIVVVCTAAKTVELLAKGLRTKFGGFVGMVFPFLIKRAKDKKKNVRDAVSSSLEAVAETTTSERIQKDILDWFAIPSPESKQTLLEFLYRYFVKMDRITDLGFVKAIINLVVKCATDSDVNVRDKACMSLGSLRRLMSDSLSPFIVSIAGDNSKMEKIAQYEQQAKEEYEKLQSEKPKRHVAEGEVSETGTGNEQGSNGIEGEENIENIDAWEMLEAEDIAKKLEKNVESLLVDKNWKERLAGCEAVKKGVDSVGRIEITDRLREISIILIRIIEKDVNVNVASCSANILTGIAIKARFPYSSLANKSFPICFDKLKDKKALLRDALNEYIDAAATTTPLSSYCEAVQGGLTSKNPQTRQQTALFLSRLFSKHDEKTVDIESVKILTEFINKISNDADKDVREASLCLVSAIQKTIGEGPTRRMFPEVLDDSTKSEKIPKIIEELEEQFGKKATVEMKRLAKQYGGGIGNGGGGGGNNSSNTQSKKPLPSKPAVRTTTTNRPISRPQTAATSKPVPKPIVKPAAPIPPKPIARPQSVKPVAAQTTRPISAPRRPLTTVTQPAPKPFVARPAPSFCNKPKPKTEATVRSASPMNKNPTNSSFGIRPPSPSLIFSSTSNPSINKPRPIPPKTDLSTSSSSRIRPPSRSRLPTPNRNIPN